MKEIIEKLERILELTDDYGIYVESKRGNAEHENELRYTHQKVKFNAIKALELINSESREIAAMEQSELTKEDSPQGVLSRISNRLHNIGCEHQDSELGDELSEMACEMWKVLPMISNEEEEQPKQYKYAKVDFDHAWVAAKGHEDRTIELWRKSDIGEAIKGNNWKAIQSPSEAAQYHFDLYRRIELTAEDLHEQKVEELARVICCSDVYFSGDNPQWPFYRDDYIKNARAALEWMKQEGGV